mgnify:CR=1 FL=1
MLEDVVASLLSKHLGRYLDGLQNLSISLLNGNGELLSLSLKPNALAEYELPFEVLSGTIERVQFKVPWANLANEPTVVRVRNVALTIQPRPLNRALHGEHLALQRARQHRTKMLRLAAHEQLRSADELANATAAASGSNTSSNSSNALASELLSSSRSAASGSATPSSSSSGSESFTEKMTKLMLDKLQVTIEGLTIRYQDYGISNLNVCATLQTHRPPTTSLD